MTGTARRPPYTKAMCGQGDGVDCGLRLRLRLCLGLRLRLRWAGDMRCRVRAAQRELAGCCAARASWEMGDDGRGNRCSTRSVGAREEWSSSWAASVCVLETQHSRVSLGSHSAIAIAIYC